MQVQRVQNNNNYNPHFQALDIKSAERIPCWNGHTELLDSFIKNQEVQKFVKILHDKGKDVEAWFDLSGLYPESGRIELCTTIRKSGLREVSLRSPITREKLNTFSAEEALTEYQNLIQEQLSLENELKKSTDFVDRFNKALDEPIAETTPKKWWEFWSKKG